MPAGNGSGPIERTSTRKNRSRPLAGLFLYATKSHRGTHEVNLKLSKAAKKSLSELEHGVRVSYEFDGVRIVLYAHPQGRYSMVALGSARFTLDDSEFKRWFPHRPEQSAHEAFQSLAPFTYFYSDLETTFWRPQGSSTEVTALRFDPEKPTSSDDPSYGHRTTNPDSPGDVVRVPESATTPSLLAATSNGSV